MAGRFLTVADVTEVLNISAVQAYGLLRSGELVGIQIGNRGIWRIEASELEAYIQRMYAQSRARVESGRTEAGQHEAGQDATGLGAEGSATAHEL